MVSEPLLDAADLAAIRGDHATLTRAITELARRLLQIRPFRPDGADPLPVGWKQVLSAWLAGADGDQIGSQNMKVVEDVFTYRLVWGSPVSLRRLCRGSL